MKNYIYLSDKKLELFYPQVRKRWIEKLGLKLGFKHGPVSGEVSVNSEALDNRELKLRKIIEHSESQGEIGTIEEPKNLFRGKCDLKLIVEGPYAFFVGWTEDGKYLSLCCSLRHMIGYENIYQLSEERNQYVINSNNYGFSSVLAKMVSEELAYEKHSYKRREKKKKQWLNINLSFGGEINEFEAVVRAANNWPGGRRPYEFVALSLGQGIYKEDSVLIGSPFYVDQLPFGFGF